MSYSRKEEYLSELCGEIDDMIGVNRTVETANINGEVREVTCVSSKFNAYDKGDTVIFSFDDPVDYHVVLDVFRSRSRFMYCDDAYLEFRFSLV